MKFISPPDEAECDSNQMAKHCRVIFVIKNVHLRQIYFSFFFRLQRTKKQKAKNPLLVDSESTL